MKNFLKHFLLIFTAVIFFCGCGSQLMTAEDYACDDITAPYGSIVSKRDYSKELEAAKAAGNEILDNSGSIAGNASKEAAKAAGKSVYNDVADIVKDYFPDQTSDQDDLKTSDIQHVDGFDVALAPSDYDYIPDVSVASIAPYKSDKVVEINNNEPFFSDEDKTNTNAWEYYGDLDELGRVTVTFSNACLELMPTEERGDISSVKPTGWRQQYYDFVDNGGALYNRMHMQAFMLTGENDLETNLVTGTVTCNQQMLEYEMLVRDYIYATGNHVLYRVVPLYIDDNLLASGILMEAYSVEDHGKLSFCVYCYNVEDGVIIDYKSGANCAA